MLKKRNKSKHILKVHTTHNSVLFVDGNYAKEHFVAITGINKETGDIAVNTIVSLTDYQGNPIISKIKRVKLGLIKEVNLKERRIINGKYIYQTTKRKSGISNNILTISQETSNNLNLLDLMSCNKLISKSDFPILMKYLYNNNNQSYYTRLNRIKVRTIKGRKKQKRSI